MFASFANLTMFASFEMFAMFACFAFPFSAKFIILGNNGNKLKFENVENAQTKPDGPNFEVGARLFWDGSHKFKTEQNE